MIYIYICVFGVNTTPSLYHSAPMFCVSPQQLYIVQNHAPQHHTHRGSLAARGLRSIGVFGSTLRCLETNAFLQKLLAGSIYPGGGPQVSVEIPGDLKMQAGDPGGDEDFPSCVGGVDPTYMGFFVHITREKNMVYVITCRYLAIHLSFYILTMLCLIRVCVHLCMHKYIWICTQILLSAMQLSVHMRQGLRTHTEDFVYILYTAWSVRIQNV